MTKNPEIFLTHIVESVELIEKRIKNKTFSDFENDIDLQDMIIRRLEIIGEAVKNLPADFRNQHKKINWNNPAGMRDVLIHHYYEADTQIIWNTITKDIPYFKIEIMKIIKAL